LSQQQAEELREQKELLTNQLIELNEVKAKIQQRNEQLENDQAQLKTNKLRQQMKINRHELDNLKEFVNNSRKTGNLHVEVSKTPQWTDTNVTNRYPFSPSSYNNNRHESQNQQPYVGFQNDSNKPLKIDPNTPVFG